MAEPAERARRVTISDIAERAGVSKGAVSYALNGRPGVSDGTRARILEIARELGWYPNRAARALSVERADACGLVLARPAKTIALEPFFMEFIAGVESELSARSIALTIQLVAVGRGRDRGVPALVGRAARGRRPHRRPAGRRPPSATSSFASGLPAVVIGGPVENGALPAVWHDEAGVVIEAVRYVAALGHTRIARVAGVGEFVHTAQRTEGFLSATRGARARGRDRRHGLLGRERRPRDTEAPLVAASRRARSSTTAICSPSPASESRCRWASQSRTRSRSSAGTTR